MRGLTGAQAAQRVLSANGVILLPCVLLSAWASSRVNSTFRRYSQQRSMRGLTGAQAAQRVLSANGVWGVRIERVRGKLTDHYDPRGNVIRLSDDVYDSTSTAAIGVACHEAGHAVQYAVGYAPIKLRAAVIPLTNFGSKLAMPLILLGMLFSVACHEAGHAVQYAVGYAPIKLRAAVIPLTNFGSKLAMPLILLGMLFSGFGFFFYNLVYVGIACFGLSLVFQLVTLPVEFNASRRALSAIQSGDLLTPEEYDGARKVLSAAAMTYVAATAVSVAQLMHLLVIFGRRIQSGDLLTPEEYDGARKVLSAAAMTYVAATAVSVAQLMHLLVIFGRRNNNDD